MNTGKDHLGQECKVGDWAAMTQNNVIYAGKIVKMSKNGNPTVAENSVQEFAITNPKFKKLTSWKDKEALMVQHFGSKYARAFWYTASWCRDKKFIKIEPTTDMIIKYDVVKDHE